MLFFWEKCISPWYGNSRVFAHVLKLQDRGHRPGEETNNGRRPEKRGEEEDATSYSVLLSTSTAENQLFRATQEIEPDQLESPNIPPILSNVY